MAANMNVTMETDNITVSGIIQTLNMSTHDVNMTGVRPFPHPVQELLMWSIVLLMLTLNLVVFVVAPKMKLTRPSTISGIMSLAVTDFLVGIIGVVLVSYNTYTGYQLHTEHPVCFITALGVAVFSLVSAATVTFLNLDRLLVFAFPFRYQLSIVQATIVNVVIWVVTIALVVPYVTSTKEDSLVYLEHGYGCMFNSAIDISHRLIMTIVFFFVLAAINVMCFCGSFYLARYSHRGLKRQSDSQIHRGSGSGRRNSTSQWKRDRRILKVLAIMTLGFYIAWMPFYITIALWNMITGHTLHPVTDFISPWLVVSNSFWNPVIYMLTLRPFKVAMLDTCRRMPCVKRCMADSNTETNMISSSKDSDDNNEKTNSLSGQRTCSVKS